MKSLRISLLVVVALLTGNWATAQCNVVINPSATNITCGDTVQLVALGLPPSPVLETTFNNNQLGSGWSSSATLVYNNPCGPSLDGTPSAWFGNVPFPRTLTTNGFDVSCGGQVCFDLDFAGDDPCGGCTDCEDPDLNNEGVYFQYSIDGGTNWVDINYFQASNGNTEPWYAWDNYCFDIPPAAQTANTMFQWMQIDPTDEQYDHWGIDNVIITPSDCGYYYDWAHVPGSPDNASQTELLTSTTAFSVIYTNGVDDSCTANVNINVTPFDVSVTATPANLNCGECADLAMILNNPPTSSGSYNYTYVWTPNTDVLDEFAQNTSACPSDNITYTGTITETTTGCTGNDDVAITVNGGGADASFTVFPGLTGCPPFDVDFTNTSTGVSYEWFIDGVSQGTTVDFSNTFVASGQYDVELVAFFPGSGCINWDTASVVIDVGNAIVPVADFDFNFECGITAIEAWQTGSNGLTYDWDMGDGTIYNNTDTVNHTFPSTGTYTVTLTVGDGICGTSATYQEVINVVDNPITYIFNDPTCNDFSDGSVTVNLLYNTGSEVCVITDATGTQVNGTGTFTANNVNGGWYFIDIDLGFGCTAADSVELWNPDPIVPSVSTTDVLCNGDPSGTAIVDTVAGWQGSYSDLAFFWNPATGVSGIGADTSLNMFAGSYVLTINDGNGCSNTYDFTINEPPALVFAELGSDPAYCRVFDYQIGNGVVWASAGGGTPDYDYIWTNLQDSSSTSFTTWGALNPGEYWIKIQDGNGCVLQDTITVDEAFPIADFTMTSPDFVANYEGTAPVAVHFVNQSQFFANPNNPNADTTFYWNFNTGNPPGWIISHDLFEEFDTTYLDGGTYEVCLVAINKNGCTDTTCKEIIVYDPLAFGIVNVFTPNGDGNNDEFTFVYKADAVAEFQCTLVNRWGQTLREFTDIADTWDGTDKNGSECKDGVYFYVYSGVADDGTTFEGQGTVNLIRGDE